MLKKWSALPDFMQVPEVKPYYDVLRKKRFQLLLKRFFDILLSLIGLIIVFLPMLVIAIMIKCDSKGPVFYRQERVTKYGKHFRIHKFRTMVNRADQIGSTVTVGHDSRITKIGSKLRGCRLDELPQLIDVLTGNMSFVGTRPEAVKYVEKYEPEYNATLLLPAGITSNTSLRYKDEDKLLSESDDVDRVYVEKILPDKMKYNLESISHFSIGDEFLTMCRTFGVLLGKEVK